MRFAGGGSSVVMLKNSESAGRAMVSFLIGRKKVR